MNKINIEIFCAPNCNSCGRAVKLVQGVISDLNSQYAGSSIHWRKLNVVDEVDYAVSLGIRATPAISINGLLEFTAAPDKKMLKKKIEELL